MYLEYENLTNKIIGCAIKVHRILGPGFLESIYEKALVIELNKCGLEIKQQYETIIKYDKSESGKHRIDLLIENKIVLELKAVKNIENIHFSIVSSYLRALNLSHGLILNFNKVRIDIKRVIAAT